MPKINEWLTADTLSGTSGVTVVRITAATQSQMEERTASFTVRGRNETVRVTAVQEAPVLDFSVSPSTVTLPWTGGSQTVSVYSTLPWTAGAGKDWLGLSPASGNPGTTEVAVTADAQTISLARSGVIDFYVFGEKVGSLTAVQEEGAETGNVLMYTSSDGQIIIPEGIEEMGTVVGHSYEDGIGSIYFAEPVTKIPASAYYGNDRLTGIWLPSTVTEIGNRAFSTCENLKYMSIKGTVVYGGNDCFKDTDIAELHVESLEQWLQCGGGSGMNAFPMREGTVLYVGESPLTGGLTVPTGITKVGNGALYSYPLDSITIPDTFSGAVGEYAFCGTGSRHTYVGSGVSGVGTDSFTGCEGYFEISCNSDYGFGQCPGVTELTLNSGLGWNLRNNFTAPVTINYNGGQWDGTFSGFTSVETLNINAPDTEVYSSAFRNCPALSAVTGWENVRKLGSASFSGCSSLAVAVSLSDCTMNNGSQFAGSAIKSFEISGSGSNVSDSCCDGCLHLEKIRIAGAGIGSESFANCPVLSEVRYESISSIGYDTYAGSDSIDNVYTDSLDWWLDTDWQRETTNPLWGGAALWENDELITDISPVYSNKVKRFVMVGCSSVTGASFTVSEGIYRTDMFAGYFHNSALKRLMVTAAVNYPLYAVDFVFSSAMLSGCRHMETIVLNTPSRYSAASVRLSTGGLRAEAFTNIREGGTLLWSQGAEVDEDITGSTVQNNLTYYKWNGYSLGYIEAAASGGTYTCEVPFTLPDGQLSYPEWMSTSALTSDTGITFTVDVQPYDGTVERTATIYYGGVGAVQVVQVAVDFTNPTNPNEIWYMTNNGESAATTPHHSLANRLVSNTYQDGLGILTFEFPVTSTPKGLFSGATNVTDVALPSTTEVVDEWFCFDCQSLERIIFGGNEKYIGYEAFGNCDSLSDFELPESLVYIDTCAIIIRDDETGPTGLTFGPDIQYIGKTAVACNNVRDITFKGSEPPMMTGNILDIYAYGNIHAPSGSDYSVLEDHGFILTDTPNLIPGYYIYYEGEAEEPAFVYDGVRTFGQPRTMPCTPQGGTYDAFSALEYTPSGASVDDTVTSGIPVNTRYHIVRPGTTDNPWVSVRYQQDSDTVNTGDTAVNLNVTVSNPDVTGKSEFTVRIDPCE